MSTPVPRKKCHAASFERADHDGVGGIAERRLHAYFTGVRQAGHAVEAASADDADLSRVSRFDDYFVFAAASLPFRHSRLHGFSSVDREWLRFESAILFAQDMRPAYGHHGQKSRANPSLHQFAGSIFSYFQAWSSDRDRSP